MMDLIQEVKKKKEFSKLPDSLIAKSLILSKNDVKETRSFLRKYFGVFITNKVLKLSMEDILKSHISSKNRDYNTFYKELFKNKKDFSSIIDLGCGVNGFSYRFLKEFLGNVNYLGIEATGQLVENMNSFFKENKYINAKSVSMDLFDIKNVEKLIVNSDSPKAILLLQVIDALEGFERDFSKKLILMISENITIQDVLIISMPMKSISGRKSFEAKRGWLRWFLDDLFLVEEFFIGDERIFSCTKK